MKYLYDLVLNHRDQIINKTAELCAEDSIINDGCNSVELRNNIIYLLEGAISYLFRNQSCSIVENASRIDFEKFADQLYMDIIHFLSDSAIDIRTFVAVMKHYRDSINDFLFQTLGDVTHTFKCINLNIRFFDMFEHSLYTYWDSTKSETLCQAAPDIVKCHSIEELQQQINESKKLINEVMENDKMRTEFYSNLSHELRTPLNVILGTLQLVDMYSYKTIDPAMEKAKKYYKIMRQNCYRLLRLVNNLIDLNKIDAGYMQMNMANHDIVGIISKIAASVSDYIEGKGIDFNYCTKTCSMIIACDPDKIERILLNLLSNAIKFTDSGGKIFVNVWDEDSKLYISVKDSGVGISKEKQELIFGRFIQVEKSLSRNHHGSGIGLSLVKSMVELHGGKISLNSDGVSGSEFIIELPIKELNIMELSNKESEYNSNNKIEVINIEFSDIYS